MSKRLFPLFLLVISSVTPRTAIAQGQPGEPLPPPANPPGAPPSPPPPGAPAPPSATAPTPAPTPAPVSANPELAPPPAAAAVPEAPPVDAKKKPSSAFAIESDDGKNKLEFHALIHADGRWFFPRTGEDTTDTFVM